MFLKNITIQYKSKQVKKKETQTKKNETNMCIETNMYYKKLAFPMALVNDASRNSFAQMANSGSAVTTK